ncbi:MAG: AmmeMemoRadiSam system protein B [bacterium]
MGKVVFGAIMPHPPILVPTIGGKRLKLADKSLQGCRRAAVELKKSNPDIIIVVTPHGQVGQTAAPIYTNPIFEGSFGNFGQPKPVYSFHGLPKLANKLVNNCPLSTSSNEGLLDHGLLVPLYFVQEAGVKKPIIPVAVAMLPLPKLFEFGQQLATVIMAGEEKVAIIASADMSHRLTPEAPAGYSPRGKEFDEKLVALIKANDVQGVLNFDPTLAEEAGQDALWSIAILLGVLDGLNAKQEVLSYEGPFGVGYMTAIWNIQ